MLTTINEWMRFFMYTIIMYTCLQITAVVSEPFKHIVHVFVEPEVAESVPPLNPNNNEKERWNDYEFNSEPEGNRKTDSARRI